MFDFKRVNLLIRLGICPIGTLCSGTLGSYESAPKGVGSGESIGRRCESLVGVVEWWIKPIVVASDRRNGLV